MIWRTACNNATCVEVAYVSACESSACVEVLNDGDRVLVRSTTMREHVVEFTRDEWVTFLDGVKRGVFDAE